MEEIKKTLAIYKYKTKATDEECATFLGLKVEQIKGIENSSCELDKTEQKRVLTILQTTFL